MDITDNTRALILQAIRSKGLNQTELAKKMGYGKPWASKLLGGGIKRLSDSDVDKLEEFLGINFFVVTKTAKVSGFAVELSELAASNPTLASVLLGILELQKEGSCMVPKYIPTQDMTRIGQEIIKLVFANEDKPGKVAREVLKLLS